MIRASSFIDSLLCVCHIQCDGTQVKLCLVVSSVSCPWECTPYQCENGRNVMTGHQLTLVFCNCSGVRSLVWCQLSAGKYTL